MLKNKIFYMAGCQRSGTTLMRLVLESHSNVSCFDEAEGYKLLTAGEQSWQSLLEKKLVGFKIPRFSEQLLWENMSDMDYGNFRSFYQNERVVYMVRDYRDVVHSMGKLRYPDGMTWLNKYGRAILKYQSNRPEFGVENRQLYEAVESSGCPGHLVGALYWKYKTEGIFPLINKGMPVLPVCYEKLVSNPGEELLCVVEFLGLCWEDALLSHSEQEHPELDDNGLAIGGTNPKLAIHANSVMSYKNVFSAKELDEMYGIVSPVISKLKALNIYFQ